MQVMASHWEPRALVENAAKKPYQEFSAEVSASFVLVIPITDPQGELAQGLASTARSARSIGYQTMQGSLEAFAQAPRKVARASQFPRHQWTVPGSYVPIPRQLLQVVCHVLPIRKRSGAAFLERISVGRAHGHDIVLREPSISKFHGWFEATDDGQLYVGDAGSRNHTFVNGSPISERTRVLPGAKLRFGLLDSHVYSLEGFWKSLRP
jgi:hypothetical protein